VNSFKATAGKDPTERGFGLAIPIDTAFDEFSELRRWGWSPRERVLHADRCRAFIRL